MPPVKLGKRCSVWLKQEIAAINAAFIAEKSDDEIRVIVGQIPR